MLTVTTSWDDGDVLDTKLANLLESFGIPGTFYIAKSYRAERLSEESLRSLDTFHEIGAHSLTHPDLTSLSREQKVEEIQGSKKWLEDVLQREVPQFCYPSGHYDAETVDITRDAGFKIARTTKLASLKELHDPLQMETTLSVYPMPFRKLNANALYFGKLLQPFTERAPALRALGVPLVAFRSFESLARSVFDIALTRGGTFHLWGHSWEIEKYGMWQELERVLRYISNRPDCRYVANGNLV